MGETWQIVGDKVTSLVLPKHEKAGFLRTTAYLKM